MSQPFTDSEIMRKAIAIANHYVGEMPEIMLERLALEISAALQSEHDDGFEEGMEEGRSEKREEGERAGTSAEGSDREESSP